MSQALKRLGNRLAPALVSVANLSEECVYPEVLPAVRLSGGDFELSPVDVGKCLALISGFEIDWVWFVFELIL